MIDKTINFCTQILQFMYSGVECKKVLSASLLNSTQRPCCFHSLIQYCLHSKGVIKCRRVLSTSLFNSTQNSLPFQRLIQYILHTEGLNAKRFYLLPCSIALRTLFGSTHRYNIPLNFKQDKQSHSQYEIIQSITILQCFYVYQDSKTKESILNICSNFKTLD